MRSTLRRLAAPLLAAVLVLSLTTGGVAVAKRLITGADIKNNSVIGKDLKNKSVKGKDLAPTAKGMRAVAAVWADGSGCYLVPGTSRGITSCARVAEGFYNLTLSPGASTKNTYPICSLGSNGGFNTLYQATCSTGYNPADDRQLRVVMSRVPEKALTGPEHFDPVATIPVVVALP